MNLETSTSGLTGKIESIIREAEKKMFIVSPWIQLKGLTWIIKAIKFAKEKGVKFTIIARLPENKRRLQKLLTQLDNLLGESYEVYLIKRLHAKLYYNCSEALLTSLNLLASSIENNYEIGTIIQPEDKEMLDKIKKYIDFLVSEGELIQDRDSILSYRENIESKKTIQKQSWRFFQGAKVLQSEAEALKNLEHEVGGFCEYVENLVGVQGELGNSLEDLNKKIFFTVNNRKITGIKLYGWGLTTIPQSVTNLKSLEILDLGGNNFRFLPESIFRLKSLKVLNLEGNNFSYFPETITGLKSLEILNLGNNQFFSLPEAVTGLESLKELNLRDNKLTSLPESIANLKSLKKLDLGSNEIKTLPESIIQLKYLTVLNLSGNGLLKIPDPVLRLNSLEKLYLEFNKLTNIPTSIKNLTTLTHLRLDRNEITTLPSTIGDISSLKTLSVRYNNILALPNSIGNLSSLEKLWIWGNKFSTIPESILDLKKRKLRIGKYNYGK